MKLKIISGVMIKGVAVFPQTGEGKNKVDSVVEVSKALAHDLIHAKQAEVADKKAKVTVKIKDPEPETDDLDKFFGDEGEE